MSVLYAIRDRRGEWLCVPTSAGWDPSPWSHSHFWLGKHRRALFCDPPLEWMKWLKQAPEILGPTMHAHDARMVRVYQRAVRRRP